MQWNCMWKVEVKEGMKSFVVNNLTKSPVLIIRLFPDEEANLASKRWM